MSVHRRRNMSEQERVDTMPHAVPAAQSPMTSGVTAVAARTHGLSTRPLFRQEVLEFQQAGREWGRVLPIQPLPTRAGVWLVMLSVGASIAFSFYGHYARKAPGIGYLRPLAGTARVFAPQPGVISKVFVKQGDAVIAGQPLMLVATAQYGLAGGDVNTSIAQSLQAQAQSLRDQITMETDHYQSERARMTAQQDAMQAQLIQLGTQSQIQTERVRIGEMILATSQPLAAKGLMSILDQRHREDALLESRRALSAALQQVQEMEAHLSEARFTLQQAPFAHEERLRSLRDTLSATEQRLIEVIARSAYLVRAPISGDVSLLEANVGQTADPKRLQAEILPTDSTLQAELYVSAEAIGLIRSGQDVRLRYDAFPYLRYGSYHGHVVQVSHTALTQSDNIQAPISIKDPMYRITVALDQNAVSTKSKTVKLEPDMLLKADVMLEQRTIAEWFLNAIRIAG